MREIKFRSWDESVKVMLYPGDFRLYQERDNGFHAGYQDLDSYGNVHGDWIELKLMQYTGLKDKNGIDIYEGDIVECLYGVDDLVKESVVYDESECGFFPLSEQNSDFCYTDFEIVGNIYEDAEMLNATN